VFKVLFNKEADRTLLHSPPRTVVNNKVATHICVYSSNKQGFVTSFVHKYVSYMFRDDVRQSYL